MEPSSLARSNSTLVLDLFREAAEKSFTGQLRLADQQIERVVHFDAGVPIFATSSLPEENGANKKELILSLFEKRTSDFAFEAGADTEGDAAVEWSLADCLLEGVRRAAAVDSIAAEVAPDHRTVVQGALAGREIGRDARLSPSEGYVLSSLLAPTHIGEIGMMTGLGDAEARAAVCVLIALELVTLVDDERGTASQHARTEPAKEESEPPAPSPSPAERKAPRRVKGIVKPVASRVPLVSPPVAAAAVTIGAEATSLPWVMEQLSLKLKTFASADYYSILGVDKFAPGGAIAKAYEDIKGMLNGFRSEWPDSKELGRKLDLLLVKVHEAYETLSDLNRRRLYDKPKGVAPDFDSIIERGGSETTAPRNRAVNLRPGASKSESEAPRLQPTPSTPAQPASEASAGSRVNKAGVANPMQAAEQHYRRGRALFEENDFHTAAHMFREAIKLDDSWATYHFYLGKTLAILSQARQIHKHHDGCHVTCKLGGNLVRNSRIRHEAEQAMLKAAELDPSNPEILVKLGQLYKEAGMAKKAEQYFRDTLILDGRNRIALEELGIEED